MKSSSSFIPEHERKQLFTLSLSLIQILLCFHFLMPEIKARVLYVPSEHTNTWQYLQGLKNLLSTFSVFNYHDHYSPAVCNLPVYFHHTIHLIELTRENPDHSYFSLQCLTIVV